MMHPWTGLALQKAEHVRRKEARQMFDDVDLDRVRMDRDRPIRQRVHAALHVQTADDVRDGLPAEASSCCWGCYGAIGDEDLCML